MMNRQEHLDWCKNRALEYVEMNDRDNAFASMLSDMGKHDETTGHLGLELGMTMKLGGLLDSNQQMRDWIIGFN